MRHVTRLAYVLRLLAGLVITSLVMGLLAAGVLLPTVGAAGSATNGAINVFNTMPADMDMTPLAQQTKILAADGTVLATPYNDNRVPVPLNQIAPVMREAQVAIEDQRFYQHGGVDPRGVLRALTSNLFGGSTQGASTLTQQYVKVALQNQALASGNTSAAAAEVTQTGMAGYTRKLQQLKIAVELEKKYTKDQILDGYLNLVYYGDQQYGIEAASIHYYGIHASQLNLNQAATMAGVVNAPGIYDPVTNPQNAKERRNLVLQKMYENHYITYKQMVDTQNQPIQLHPGKEVSSSCADSKYPYFCYYVQAWLLQQPALGKTVKEREATLATGGVTVKTTLQPKLADIINKQIRAKVPQGNRADVQSAGVIVQPGTGKVLAMGQNTAYSNTAGTGLSAINFNTPYGLGGPYYGFDFGSTDKLFALVTALKQGRTIDSTVNIPAATGDAGGDPYHIFTSAQFPGKCGLGAGEQWRMFNDVPVAAGPMSLTNMTAQSVNTGFATLVSQLGACNVHDTMTAMGLTQANGSPISTAPAAITLGASPVAPVTLASSYAAIDAGGKWCPPTPVESITDANGKNLTLQGTACKQVVSKDVANGVIRIMQAVLNQSNGTAYGHALAGGRPAWGKTGTTDSALQTWFIGSTPQMTTAVWVGRLNSQVPMKNIWLGGQYYPGYVFGGTVAAPLWQAIMNEALQGQPVEQFTAPSQSIIGNSADLPAYQPGVTQSTPTQGTTSTPTAYPTGRTTPTRNTTSPTRRTTSPTKKTTTPTSTPTSSGKG